MLLCDLNDIMLGGMKMSENIEETTIEVDVMPSVTIRW